MSINIHELKKIPYELESRILTHVFLESEKEMKEMGLKKKDSVEDSN